MMNSEVYDFVVIGSGFGGSISAMRLTEKGHKVLVLERGKRWQDHDFPKTNWNLRKFLWLPFFRCFGIQQLSLLNDVLVIHGSGVGGGSLIYANVLMEPSDELFNAEGWSKLGNWKQDLKPYYETAKYMLGVTPNPFVTPADKVLREMARDYGREDTFKMANVAVFYGDEGQTVSDPYFGGAGPDRTGCIQCGGCMIGCQHNAKNTLVKNYLYFAEKWGAEIRPESEVLEIRALPQNQSDGARYEIVYHRVTFHFWHRQKRTVRTKNVVVSAHALGTLKLLFHCRDVAKTLPDISTTLGGNVRTNSETIPGSTSRSREVDFSTGAAITSIFALDDITRVEPVRYPNGSGFIRMLGIPMIETDGGFWKRLFLIGRYAIQHPRDFLYTKFFGNWSKYTTILLIMQTQDSLLRINLGRNLFTFFRRGLVTQRDANQQISPPTALSHKLMRDFAKKTNGIPQDSIPETLLGIPTTAHLIGGVPMGHSAEDGVVNKYCEVFNYPGMYVVDGSIIPANPGINPSLTIAALAEYAMDHIEPQAGFSQRKPLGLKSNP